MAHKVTLFFDYLKGERSLFCKIHTYLRTNLHFFSFTSKGKVFLFAQNEVFFFCILSFASLWEVLRPLLRSRQSRQAMFSDEAQHILRRTAAYSPSKHSPFSLEALCIFPKRTFQNLEKRA